MYESFYGLDRKPFNLTPDPAFLYLSKKHQEAFAHLVYGIKNRSGFVMVSGEIGTGKTTISRALLNQLDAETEVAFIFNPFLSPLELLQKINGEFGVESRAETVRELIDELNNYLLHQAAEGKNCVLVIDEAQNLEPQVLEQIRLLSNLETETQKLLQIVLIGQPELAEKLELNELRQLNQRITARYHLQPLDFDETRQYLAFRLRVAGGRKKVKFTHRAVRQVYKISRGTPRVINSLCDRALLVGYTKEKHVITPGIVKRAAKELEGEGAKRMVTAHRRVRLRPSLIGAAALAAAALVVALQDPGNWFTDTVEWAGRRTHDMAQRIAVTPGEESQVVRETQSHSLPLAEAASGAVEPPAPDPDIPPPSAAPEPKADAPGREPSRDNAQPSGDAAQSPATVDDFAAYVAGLDPDTARNAGLKAILDAWSLAVLSDYPADNSESSLAQFAVTNGMAYERLAPSVDQLYAINFPALTQVAADGGVMWLALLEVAGEHVQVQGEATSAVRISRGQFEDAYTGNAAVFWIDPAPERPLLRPNTEGEDVIRLQRDLHNLELEQREPTGVYDDATEETVRRIQEAAGLEVDGIVGRQTRMVLSSWLGHGPSLRADALPTALRERVRVEQSSEPETGPPPQPEAESTSDGESAQPESPAPATAEPESADTTPEAGSPDTASPDMPDIQIEELDDQSAEPVIDRPLDRGQGDVTAPSGGLAPITPRRQY